MIKKWLDPKEFKDIPDDIRDYTPEQREAMREGLTYVLLLACSFVLLVVLFKVPTFPVLVAWYISCHLLISKPAIKDRVQRNKEKDNG